MPSTYSNLKVQLMATGENTGTWGNVTNENLGTTLEQAIVETATVTFASANQTLTLTDSNARQDARALRLNLTGTTGGARDLIVPAIQKPYLVNNGTADTITVKVSGQTGIAVPAGKSMLLYNNGTDVGLAFNRVVADVVGNVTGNVTGTASNATVLQTARNIQISGNVTAANVSFDGSAAVNLSVTAINASGITSGTLAVGQGGTGAATLTAENVIIGNGTSAVKFVAAGTSGNVLTSNGTTWSSQAISAGGDYIMRTYNSPATWTKPAGLKAVKVTVVGGGGGARGNPTPASTAPAGGTSSFGPFCSATGGLGGAVSVPSCSVGEANGSGGVGSGGDLNLRGGAGLAITLLTTTGPTPAMSPMSLGGGSIFGGAGTPPAKGALSGSVGTGGSTTGSTMAGGAGGAAIEYLDAPAIPGPVSVTVGAGGTASPLPAPLATSLSGGVGGVVIVEEFY